jgi:hypothetical protein
MSMLTPPELPGMGGRKGREFRVTGGRYPRMRRRPRRRRIVLAAAAAVAMLTLLGYGTVQLVDVFTADGTGEGGTPAQAGGDAAGAPADGAGEECPPGGGGEAGRGRGETAARLPEPEAVTVNVYNATRRTNLARRTADALAERGFVIGEVANAPEELDGRVEAPGLLLATAAAEESGAMTVVGAQLAGAEARPGQDTAAARRARDVDLVLGHGFAGLTPAAEADRALAALANPSPSTNC